MTDPHAHARWVSPETLAEWVADSRGRTMELVADLSDEQLVGPLLPVVNPLIWEIGHLAWFQERFVLRDALGRPPLLDEADALWDSGAVPHDTRWRLQLPSRSETLRYLEQVRDQVVEAVLAADCPDVVRHYTLYSVFHEDVHTEAITWTRQTLGYPAPKLAGLSETSPVAPDAGPLPGDVEVAGGDFLLGATMDQPFVYDNERWGHRVRVAPFAIARAPVTQEEFAAFVDDGGYERRELWSPEGWAWREATGATHPVYWRRADGQWQRRHFDQWRPLEPHRPVVHVCFHEAEAYARWAGRRLATEIEWEVVAASAPGAGWTEKRRYPWGDEDPRPEHANLEWRAMETVDVGAHPEGDSPFGVRQLIGNVWEWTGSTFWPYPHFERDAYGDNSEPWFGQRKVLRGGAWPNRGRYLRNTFRNYFTPDRRDVFAGFRTCAVGE